MSDDNHSTSNSVTISVTTEIEHFRNQGSFTISLFFFPQNQYNITSILISFNYIFIFYLNLNIF